MSQPIDAVDDDLPELAALVSGLVGDALDAGADEPEPPFVVETMTIDLPIELRVRQSTTLRLVMTPPLQKIETTILPVWHRLRLTVVEDHAR